MKKWPKDDKPVGFEDLANGVVGAIKQCYKLIRININKNVKYKGYDISKKLKASCFPPNEALRVKNLKYDLEDQGREAIDVLIGIALQLGIEQGRRMEREEWKRKEKWRKLGVNL